MKHINCPINRDTGKILNEINSFPRATEKENRISRSKGLIIDLSNRLESNFNSNNYVLPVSAAEIEATKDDMISLYRDKFCKSAYYNMLVTQFVKCPICGVRFVETVDHYLPKSVHYLYSITPINLVPMCFRCNKDKGETNPITFSYHIFHPYFDKINNLNYLEMTFCFDEYNNFIPHFKVVGDDKPEKELFETNYRFFKLKEKYEEESVKLFQENKLSWIYLLNNIGESKLKDFIFSSIKFDMDNPVIGPFFKSLYSNFDTLVSYLKSTL